VAEPRTPDTCGACGSEDLTRLPMVLTDGTEVTFVNCQACEEREWLSQDEDGTWYTLPIETVLQRSAKRRC
jgi:siroheme synthase (precorrin-2 oxidase/ferrochelatase)